MVYFWKNPPFAPGYWARGSTWPPKMSKFHISVTIGRRDMMNPSFCWYDPCFYRNLTRNQKKVNFLINIFRGRLFNGLGPLNIPYLGNGITPNMVKPQNCHISIAIWNIEHHWLQYHLQKQPFLAKNWLKWLKMT